MLFRVVGAMGVGEECVCVCVSESTRAGGVCGEEEWVTLFSTQLYFTPFPPTRAGKLLVLPYWCDAYIYVDARVRARRAPWSGSGNTGIVRQ